MFVSSVCQDFWSTQGDRNDNLHLFITLFFSTGVLQTNQSYGKYADGYFEVKVKASNSPDPSKRDFTFIKIFVLQDTDLMKFVFDKNPVQVHRSL